MRIGQGWARATVAAVCTMLAGSPVKAHPHILIEARAKVLFNADGAVIGIENTWDFDKAFSAFAIQGYDAKGDGQPSEAELQPLAAINVDALKAYAYFTTLKIGTAKIALGAPQNFFDTFNHDVLELHFIMPTIFPVKVAGQRFQVDVFDPEYFAAISFAKSDPVTLLGNHPACELTLHRPGLLDPAVAARVAIVPASQHDLPPDLFAATAQLVNGVLVACP